MWNLNNETQKFTNKQQQGLVKENIGEKWFIQRRCELQRSQIISGRWMQYEFEALTEWWWWWFWWQEERAVFEEHPVQLSFCPAQFPERKGQNTYEDMCMLQYGHRYKPLLRKNMPCTGREILGVRYVHDYEGSYSIKDEDYFYYQTDRHTQDSSTPFT